MKAAFVSTEVFQYTAELTKLAAPADIFSLKFSSTWLGAKDLIASRSNLQAFVDRDGLAALRDLIDAELRV